MTASGACCFACMAAASASSASTVTGSLFPLIFRPTVYRCICCLCVALMDAVSADRCQFPNAHASPCRDRIRGFIEQLIEEELAVALGRGRYERRHWRGDGEVGSPDNLPAGETADGAPLDGHRHGHRERRITGSFGTVEIAVPRARIGGSDGTGREWKSKVLPRSARMSRQVEALIAGTYLAGTHTRRVRRALAALFKGAIGKDAVSRSIHPFE